MKNLTLIAAALSAMLTLAGCDTKSNAVTPSPVEPSPAPPIPQRFATLEDLKPHQSPSAEANLLLGGVEVPVTLVSLNVWAIRIFGSMHHRTGESI